MANAGFFTVASLLTPTQVEVKFGDSLFVSAMSELRVKEGGEEGIKFVRGMRNVG